MLRFCALVFTSGETLEIVLYKARNNVNIENDVLFQKVTQAYSEKKSECSYQESNLRPSDY